MLFPQAIALDTSSRLVNGGAMLLYMGSACEVACRESDETPVSVIGVHLNQGNLFRCAFDGGRSNRHHPLLAREQ